MTDEQRRARRLAFDRADLAAVRDLLADLPADEEWARPGLERREAELVETIAALEES